MPIGSSGSDMLAGDDQIRGDGKFEPAADGVSVDRGDHRLVKVPQLGQAGEAAWAVIQLPPFTNLLDLARGLEVPAGGENAVAGRRDDADAQLRIIAKLDEGVPKRDRGQTVHRIHFRTIERHLEHMAAPLNLHRIRHAFALLVLSSEPMLFSIRCKSPPQRLGMK
jgi:hypothetical protein